MNAPQYETLPTANGRHGLDDYIMYEIDPRYKSPRLNVHVWGHFDGRWQTRSKTFAVRNQYELDRAWAQALHVRHEYVAQIDRERSGHKERIDRVLSEPLPDLPTDIEERKENAAKTLRAVRQDVARVWATYGPVDPIAFYHYKQFQW